MNLYHATITDTGEELCVTARTTDHAAEVFVTFWIARTGSAPGEFSVGRGAPIGYHGHPVVQNLATGDAAGVLVRQPDGAVLFEPALW